MNIKQIAYGTHASTNGVYHLGVTYSVSAELGSALLDMTTDEGESIYVEVDAAAHAGGDEGEVSLDDVMGADQDSAPDDGEGEGEGEGDDTEDPKEAKQPHEGKKGSKNITIGKKHSADPDDSVVTV